jgi:EAL domain-containing protein (putative c-di-GMP-specific phosphodiesterase class I)
LKEACAQNMAWQRRGLLPLSMAVNLSPRQFADAHLLQDIDEAAPRLRNPPRDRGCEAPLCRRSRAR